MLKNFLKLFLIFPILAPVPSNASCAPNCIPYEQRLNYTREPFNNYEDEGDMRFKLRALGAMFTSGMISGINISDTSTVNPSDRLFKYGIGGEGAINYFITNHLAIELAAGIIYSRRHGGVLRSIYNKYNGTKFKGRATYIIPITATAQYHIAPYGGIQPYIGAGLHAAHTITRTKGLIIRNNYGPVLQAGLDLVYKDFNLINLDLKQYFSCPNIAFTRPLVSTPIMASLKTNPIVFSMGIGFRF